MKQNLSRFFFSLFSLFLIVLSCQREDWGNKELGKTRSAADFFKHSSKNNALAKAGVDYVSILEAYNRETNFISKIPDQRGMPIWEKMRIINGSSSTSLIIPLSEDGNTLSSILYANIINEQTVNGTNNITNEELRRVVFDSTISVKIRESLFHSFMMTDSYTFGTKLFTNIPKDLFVDNKIGDYNNRIIFEMPPFQNSENTTVSESTDSNSRLTIIHVTTCFTFHHCKNDIQPNNCDGCSDCKTTICSTEVIYTYDYPDSSGTNGYPGGTGGGGGNPSPIPNPDPCAPTKGAFYRLKPNCIGSGGGSPIIEDDPCAKLKNNLQKAKEMMDNDTVKTKNNMMKATILTDNHEKGMYWGRNSAGQMMTSNIINLSTNYGSIPISNALFTPIATGHNHNGPDLYTNFAPADINGFNGAHEHFNTINHTFANGSDGSLYVMTIEDQMAFDDFVGQYPMSSIDAPSATNPNGTGDWKVGLDIRIEEDFLLDYFKKQGKTEDEANDLALGYLIKKYNMGIMISKKGTDGKFHPIQVELITNPIIGTPIAYIQVNPCNL